MKDIEGREAKRARRIRDRDRMRARAIRAMGRIHPAPTGDSNHGPAWTDLDGNRRQGYPTLGDLQDYRRARGVPLADNLASCSCHMCGNPRRHWKQRTLQEIRAEASAAQALRAEGVSPSSMHPVPRPGWR